MDRAGALVTSLVGGVFLFGGWVLLYYGSLKTIAHSPVILGMFYAIQQFGAMGAFYAALVGNMKNFKLANRGTVVGVLVSMYGLSAFMISQLYSHVFDQEPPVLFLFMAFFTLALCVTGACAIRVVHPYSTKMRQHQKLLTVVDVQSGMEEQVYGVASDSESDGLANSRSPSPATLSEEGLVVNTNRNGLISIPEQPTNIPRYGQLRFLTLLAHPDFWLLAGVAFLTAGSGLTFITIIGSVAQSWGLTDAPINYQASTFTSVLSICNCLGRILYGVLNDALRKHVRNVTFLLPISLVISVAHFTLIFWRTVPSLMIGAILTGLSYGGFFATINIIISKYFGDENYSSNLGFNTLIISVSGLVWGQVAGALYDHHAVKKHCYGEICYRYTFAITSSMCLLSFLLALFIVWRERRDDKRKAAG